MRNQSSCVVDVASVGSSASEKGPGSGRNSPVVKDKKLFKSTGVKKEVGSLGKSSNITISRVNRADNKGCNPQHLLPLSRSEGLLMLWVNWPMVDINSLKR